MQKIMKWIQTNRKRATLIGVGLVVLILLGILIASLLSHEKGFNKETELKKMASDFYENFYYDQVGSDEETRKTMLAKFKDTGLKIDIDNLSRYQNEKNAELVKKFINDQTKKACDKEATKAIIYPKEPYGKTDYTLDTVIVCD